MTMRWGSWQFARLTSRVERYSFNLRESREQEDQLALRKRAVVYAASVGLTLTRTSPAARAGRGNSCNLIDLSSWTM